MTFGSNFDQLHLKLAQSNGGICPRCGCTDDSIQCGFVHDCTPFRREREQLKEIKDLLVDIKNRLK